MKQDEPLDRLLERVTRTADARTGACLEAETLALWADGSLPASERAVAEAHVADCDRCLAVLAALERTSPPPARAEGHSWLSLRWLVPLTTAAVVVTAWVLVQGPPRSAPQPEAPLARATDTAAAGKPSAPGELDEVAALRSNDQQKTRRPGNEPEKEKESAESRRIAPLSRQEAQRTQDAVAAPAARSAEASAPTPPARVDALEQLQPKGRAMADSVSRLIVAPNTSVRWRVTGTSVERSTDGGASWRPLSIETHDELLAGAAPSPTVCWIVGRRGTVLLSTDGETWRRVASPAANVDLVGVSARDAKNATVTAADGRSFQTSDGGLTWMAGR